MTAYFIRRLLLVPVTFIAITFLVYTLVRVLPGGPVEQAQMQRRLSAMSGEGGGGGVSRGANLQLDEDALRDLQRYYALDRPIPIGYLQWLGAWPRPFRTRVPQATLDAYKTAFTPLLSLHEARTKLRERLDALLASRHWTAWHDKIYRPLDKEETAKLERDRPDLVARARQLAGAGFEQRDRLYSLLEGNGLSWNGEGEFLAEVKGDPSLPEAQGILDGLRLAREERDEVAARWGYELDDDGAIYRVQPRFSGILELDFGVSYTHSEPVLRLVASRLPVSASLGLTGYILTWLVCVPLGIAKALRHRSAFDTWTSFVVFVGYSIPGYVLCMMLLSTVAARGWLPLGGWATRDSGLLAHLRYMVIPIAGYMVSSFATMTILMKNSLLENLNADYVRTALAKGLSERRTVWVHAVRNSLIPLTANIGTAAGVLFAGSFLVERVTNVDGMGLLGYNALLQRDYPIVLGTLVIGLVIQLLGGILSDVIWAALDPRIRFEVSA